MECPIPIRDYPVVTLAHGGGGLLMRDLIERMITPLFSNPVLNALNDSALLTPPPGDLAFTTDSFVIRPRIFPGGTLGALAIHGTTNDLAMSGATPRWLSCGLILEEGLPMDELWTHLLAMKQAADQTGIHIVCGDTKVVDRGKGDGLYINTAGIGTFRHPLRPAAHHIRSGDAVLVSGDIGRHGIAIMAVREGLAFESDIQSDMADLHPPVDALLSAGIDVHALRDCTRGGLASSLIELSEGARVHIQIEANSVPVSEAVAGACELLGLDPLYVPNEGRFVAFVPESQADQALDILARACPHTTPARIGTVVSDHEPRVLLRSGIGVNRILDLLTGEQLPRIC
ncbi:MAG TPA: hydrogenase expression/formation protein HypE [Kiritimatiellia bacterium]|nr:hydrogenase expression/formation protein HypE [Kiritimatiellia bacterium]